MIEENIDFGALTETWFQDATENWKFCDLNICPLKLDLVNRSEGKRGGTALVFKQHLKVSKILSPSLSIKSFEHGIWKIHNGNGNLTVLGIYHPPTNKKANTQDAVFVEEFINLLTDLLLNHSNIIIMVDFNMHWNKPEDPNVSIPEENATVLGLTQIATTPTHRKGNIIDLAFLDTELLPRHVSTSLDDYITDHLIVRVTLKMVKPGLKFTKKDIRPLQKINHTTLSTKMQSIKVDKSLHINESVTNLEENLLKILNEVCPYKNYICS